MARDGNGNGGRRSLRAYSDVESEIERKHINSRGGKSRENSDSDGDRSDRRKRKSRRRYEDSDSGSEEESEGSGSEDQSKGSGSEEDDSEGSGSEEEEDESEGSGSGRLSIQENDNTKDSAEDFNPQSLINEFLRQLDISDVAGKKRLLRNFRLVLYPETTPSSKRSKRSPVYFQKC